MPTAPVVSPDGKTLYLCNRFMNAVSVVDLRAGRVIARIPAAHEPVAAALTPNGRILCIANLLPTGPATRDHVASAISIIDTKTLRSLATIDLPNGATGVRGICLSPDGRFAYVTHTLGRYYLPTTQLEHGWMSSNALSIMDVEKRTLLNTVLLDEINLGAANPWGVACSGDGNLLCVAHAGTNEVSVIDRVALHRKLNRVASGDLRSPLLQGPADVPLDFTFLDGIRHRIALRGIGPRGLALSGSQVITADYFSDSLDVVNLKSDEIRSIALGAPHVSSAARQGERYFNDATICFQHWQSCATCHPDGRADGLNWDLLNDGIGNPKQTKSLLLAHKTPPVMLTGIRPRAEVAVRAGLKYILFVERPEEEATAIDQYLKSMTAVPSPYLEHGKLNQSAKRGQRIFAKARCGECHTPPLYTSLHAYDVGTGTGKDANRPYYTPTLVEIWRTAPYLCDGRAATIHDMIENNHGDKHGKTSGLTASEKRDLAVFVQSL
jgi:YVTN family beta-propeller protein